MRIPVQKNTVRLLWFFAIAGAIGQGVFLPQWEIFAAGSSASPVDPIFALVFGLIAPPLLMMATVIAQPLRTSSVRNGFIQGRMDARFGTGWSQAFLRSFKPMLLLSVFLFLLGATGIASALLNGANSFAVGVAAFFLAGGVGFGIARCIGLRLLPDEPWI